MFIRKTLFLATISASILFSCNNTQSIEKKAVHESIESEFPQKALNPIDRYGQLLVDVQMSEVFPDGKTFVDAEPKFPAKEILEKYNDQKNEADFGLREFILANFTMPEAPTGNFVTDTTRTTAEHINELWPYLKRDADEVEPGTRISLPNPYIVPGGRFREVYYWDSYFILLGLKEAGETELIENILDNFAFQINTIGFIPNGNRTYYLGRSQPPFFAEMVNLLAEIKGEKETLLKYHDALEKEYKFWMKGASDMGDLAANDRVVKVNDSTFLNRYYSNTQTPRAESFKEDINTAQKAKNRPAKEVYLNISAACESGWDFSSRWFADPNDLATIRTTEVVPVDLNSLMYNLEVTLAKAREYADDKTGSDELKSAANRRKSAINTYLWDAENKVYKDYLFKENALSETLSLAMVYPLYFDVASPEQADAIAKELQKDFLKPGGLVTTLNDNGQQWDSPNGWPPHQWLAIRGLEKYGNNDLANSIKKRWLRLNDQVYKRTGKMLEKYNVTDTTLVAGGGEYPTQDGFGWTNGVYLDLKDKE